MSYDRHEVTRQSLYQITADNPIIQMVANSVDSAHSKRTYTKALIDFLTWYVGSGFRELNRATVYAYIAELKAQDVGAPSINQRLVAIRRFALEAADNGLIEPIVADGIRRIKSIPQHGQKSGNWLSLEQAQKLIDLPDLTTIKGLRDRAILAMLLGCGLRRSELAGLTVGDIEQRDGRWVILDLQGKHNRTRTVPIPAFAKSALDDYLHKTGIGAGVIFRGMRKGDKLRRTGMTPEAVWTIVTQYGDLLGVKVRPHDLRRTFSKLSRRAGADLTQIQFTLGHESVKTTEIYVAEDQNLTHAPGDMIRLNA